MAADDYLPGPGESFWPEDWIGTKQKPQKHKEQKMPIPTPQEPTPAAGAQAKPTAKEKQKATIAAKPLPSMAPQFTFGKIGDTATGHITILYGEPGTGKSTLAGMLPGKTAYLDLEDSLGKLRESWAELGIGEDVQTVNGITDFKSLCACLNAVNLFDGFDNIVIDSLSKVMDWAKDYTYDHSPTKAKTKATCLDDYEFSTGPMYVYRWTVPYFWNPIEKHKRQGRNVFIIAHAMFETVPNGDATEFKQWQFDALMMKSGKDSIRHFMCNNSDHVLMLKADVAGDKKKNAVGGDTKTLYAAPLPYILAKSRTRHEPQFAIIPGEKFDWTQIIH